MTVKPDVVKQLAELVDGDQWVVADLLVAEFPPEEWGGADHGTNTGIYEALREYEVALAQQYGIEAKASTLRNKRATALAWPDAARTASAPYVVHEMLRGQDRQQKMASYLKRSKGKPLTQSAVRRFRAEDNPPPMVTWDAQLRRRLMATVKTALLGGRTTKRKDWWNAAGDDTRAAAVAALRDLANMLESDAA